MSDRKNFTPIAPDGRTGAVGSILAGIQYREWKKTQEASPQCGTLGKETDLACSSKDITSVRSFAERSAEGTLDEPEAVDLAKYA